MRRSVWWRTAYRIGAALVIAIVVQVPARIALSDTAAVGEVVRTLGYDASGTGQYV